MRLLRTLLLLAGIPIVVASCGIGSVHEPAEQVLAEQVRWLLGRESLAFDGEAETKTGRAGMLKRVQFQGIVRGPNEPQVHVISTASVSHEADLHPVWNPRASLERLNTIPKAVRWSQNGFDSRSLIVLTDSATAKRLLLDDWESGLVRMKEAERQKAKRLTLGHPELLPAWLREIEQAATGMRTKLRSQAETLQVETAYRLELDDQTRTPRRFTIEKRFHSADGTSEGQTVTYTFTDTGAAPTSGSPTTSLVSTLYLGGMDR